jgi:hypothetical protein
MQPNHQDIQFTAHHHALLFSSIAKSVICCLDEEKGEILIRKAVRKYGQQRGKRMALRAEKNGHDLTFANYFAYGEWEVPKNEMDFKLVERNPHARLNVFKCPWYVIWKENNLLDYGRYFCQEIDAALVKGFNPGLEMEISSTRTNDGVPCDFIFKDAGLSFFKLLGLAYKKKIRPGKKAVMDWEYHTGHLYKTLKDVISQAAGDKADEIMENALKDFSSFFSENHIAAIKKYRDTDFDKIDNYFPGPL